MPNLFRHPTKCRHALPPEKHGGLPVASLSYDGVLKQVQHDVIYMRYIRKN